MDDRSAWLIVYAGLISIKAHPRNEGASLDLDELAAIADAALERFKERF